MSFLGINSTLLELWLVNCVLAYSAFLVLTGGTFSFAYVAFIAIGAYTTAILTAQHDIPMILSVLLGPALAAVIALAIARPLQRLNGIYLAIVSVSFVGLVSVMLLNMYSLTNGALGITGIPLNVELWHLIIVVALLALGIRQLQHSQAGIAIRITRIDPLVAGAMGVNVPRLRLVLFVASAALGALAGILRAHYFGYVTPGDYGFHLVVTLLAMVVIGGVASWTGPLVGAAIFVVLPELLRSLGEWRDVITGLLLLAIAIASREGVAGSVRAVYYRWRRRRVSAGPSDTSAAQSAAGAEVRAAGGEA